MKAIFRITCLLMFSCTGPYKEEAVTAFTEDEVLKELDLAYFGIPGQYYPAGKPGDIKYNVFPDLEHGYCITAGSYIHLYADSSRWAIVFEKSGYQNRGSSISIELDYIGNCINYPVTKYADGTYIANSASVTLIGPTELERIENKKGTDVETFEFISPDITTIKVRDTTIAFDNDYRDYKKVGIEVRSFENPRKLIGFGDLARFLYETNPSVIAATQQDIRQYIPNDLPWIMTIDQFHFISIYDRSVSPSQQETYQQLAKVLVTRNAKNWRPKLAPNNNWKNWESGDL